jgi:hypothetical protein
MFGHVVGLSARLVNVSVAMADYKTNGTPRHENDLMLFHNRGVTHSTVGAFKDDQVRKFHQCNLAASDFPVGPDEDDLKAWA